LSQPRGRREWPANSESCSRDYSTAMPHLTAETYLAMGKPDSELTDKKAHVALSDALIAEVSAADAIALAVPMYNLSIPSTLKAWSPPGFSPDTEVVVYCSCPNDASAVAAVRHLRRAGFRKIRPLLGGVDAWIAAGREVVRAAAPRDDLRCKSFMRTAGPQTQSTGGLLTNGVTAASA
jgi:rhodanese-related sulfurtransferase